MSLLYYLPTFSFLAQGQSVDLPGCFDIHNFIVINIKWEDADATAVNTIVTSSPPR
jgi:hypothetical protein